MVRFKNRYLVIEVVFPDGPHTLLDVHAGTVANVIRDSLEMNFGEWGAATAAMSLSVKYYSAHTNIGIVRVARDHFRLIWGALTFITKLKNRDCIVRVIHVSGTIKKAQLATIRYDKRKIDEAKAILEAQGVNTTEAAARDERDILATEV
ncbi:hypothetical protein DFJ74DRAFT_613636 [Hyaloraphidium curvatum]|nr:hypothetical protein DFJ74DRAFT_613636 [Hyaloraphidium curvatum]